METHEVETDVLAIVSPLRQTTYVIVAPPLVSLCVNCEQMVTIQMKIKTLEMYLYEVMV